LDDRGVLVTGEKFFQKRTSLIDAMPACWMKLSVEKRHEVISIIMGMQERSMEDQLPITWRKEDIIQLSSLVKMDEVYKL